MATKTKTAPSTTTKKTAPKRRRHRRLVRNPGWREREAEYRAAEERSEARDDRRIAAEEAKSFAIANTMQKLGAAVQEALTVMHAQAAAQERRAQEIHEANLAIMRQHGAGLGAAPDSEPPQEVQ